MAMLFFCLSVRAQEKSDVVLKVAPLFFDLQIDPGGEKTGKIYIENASDQELDIVAEASDFFIDTTGNYIFSDNKSIANPELKPYLMREWFKLDADNLKLAPGEGKNVEYRVQVPGDAALGGHYGSIFFRTLCTLSQDEHVIATDKSSLCVAGRVGVLFLVQVGGHAIKSGEINHIKLPKITFENEANLLVEIKNTGNTHFIPSGNIKVAGLIGQNRQEIEIGNKILLPKQQYNFQTKIKGGDILCIYKINGSIKDGDGHNLSFQRYIFIPQWEKLVIIILIIMGLFYFYKKFRFQKKGM